LTGGGSFPPELPHHLLHAEEDVLAPELPVLRGPHRPFAAIGPQDQHELRVIRITRGALPLPFRFSPAKKGEGRKEDEQVAELAHEQSTLSTVDRRLSTPR